MFGMRKLETSITYLAVSTECTSVADKQRHTEWTAYTEFAVKRKKVIFSASCIQRQTDSLTYLLSYVIQDC